MQETLLIEKIGQWLGSTDAVADDTYVTPDNQILTTDMLVEGQHFSRDYFSPQDVAHKALAVNVSDIAATGGQPQYALISLGLPEDIDEAWLEAFYTTLKHQSDRYGCQVVGGDTVASPVLTVNIAMTGTMVGAITGTLSKNAVPGRRNQAQAGDYILLSGSTGLSALGMVILQDQHIARQGFSKKQWPQCVEKHLQPKPQLALGKALATSGQRFALMDLSDGLGDGLLKVAQASGVHMQVNDSQLPKHRELMDFLKDTPEMWLKAVLYGGEDFELLATWPNDTPLPKGWTVIGTVIETLKSQSQKDSSATVVNERGDVIHTVLPSNVYQHFTGTS